MSWNWREKRWLTYLHPIDTIIPLLPDVITFPLHEVFPAHSAPTWLYAATPHPHYSTSPDATQSLFSHCRPTPVTPVTTGVPICLHCRMTDCTLTAQPISHEVGGATLQCNLTSDATFRRLFMHEVLSRRRRSQVAETGAIMSSEWF